MQHAGRVARGGCWRWRSSTGQVVGGCMQTVGILNGRRNSIVLEKRCRGFRVQTRSFSSLNRNFSKIKIEVWEGERMNY